jgi:hypothetical protein
MHRDGTGIKLASLQVDGPGTMPQVMLPWFSNSVGRDADAVAATFWGGLLFTAPNLHVGKRRGVAAFDDEYGGGA